MKATEAKRLCFPQKSPQFVIPICQRTVNRAIQFAQFFLDSAIVSTLSTQLSWSHFIELLPIKEPLARDFYAEMCRIERWDVRMLRLKIGGMLFQGTALSSGAKYYWMDC